MPEAVPTFTATIDLRCLPALRRWRGWTPTELIARFGRALPPGETLDRQRVAATLAAARAVEEAGR